MISDLFFPQAEATVGAEQAVTMVIVSALVIFMGAMIGGMICGGMTKKVQLYDTCPSGFFGKAFVGVATVVGSMALVVYGFFCLIGLCDEASAGEVERIDIKCPENKNGTLAFTVTGPDSKTKTYELKDGAVNLPKEDIARLMEEAKKVSSSVRPPRRGNFRVRRNRHKRPGETTTPQEYLERNLKYAFGETKNLCEESPEQVESLVKDMNRFIKEFKPTYEQDDKIFSESAA